jgi:hypothetical protein
MYIGAIGQSGINSIGLSAAYSTHAQKAAEASNSQSKKDSATISEAAKELAALKSGTTSQEEANESASAKIKEQLSGLN